MAAAQPNGAAKPLAPRPPSAGSPDRKKQERAAYLRRKDVVEVIDDVVGQCLQNMPDDPTSFIISHLEQRTRSRSSSITPQASTISGDGVTGPPPPLMQQQQQSGAEELLQWLVENSTGDTPRREKTAFPAEMPPAARAHPLAGKVEELHHRLVMEREVTASSDEILSPKVGRVTSPAQHKALVRSVTRATQAIVAAGRDTDAALSALTESLRQLVSADQCSVFIVDERRRQLSTTIKGKPVVVKFGRGIAGQVAESGKSSRIAKAYEDPRFNPDVDLFVSYVTKSLLTVPMRVENRVIAVVQLVNKTTADAAFTAEDEQLIDSFTQVAGVAIRNSWFYNEAQRIAQQNALMARINAELANSELNEAKLIPTVVRGAKEIVGADRCAFFKVVDDGTALIAHLEGVDVRIKLSSAQGIVGWVAREKVTVNIPDAYADSRFNREVDQASGYRTQSLLCFPIIESHRLVAVAQLVNKLHPKDRSIIPFDAVDEECVTAFGQVAGVCMRNCHMHDELVDQQSRLEEVARIATFLSSTDSDLNNPGATLEFIAQSVRTCARAEHCIFYHVVDNEAAPGLQFAGASPELPDVVNTLSPRTTQGRDGGASFEQSEVSAAEAGPIHPIGRGLVGTLAARPRSTLLTTADGFEDMEPELRLAADQTDLREVLVVPIIDTGVPVGCCVLVNPDPETARGLLKATGIRRRDSRAALSSLEASARSTARQRIAADIEIALSMAGFTIRISRMLSLASRHGNNLAALMEVEYGDVTGGTDAQLISTDEAPVSGDNEASFLLAAGGAGGISRASFAPIGSEELDELLSISFDVHRFRRGEAPASQLLAMLRAMFNELDVLRPLGLNEGRLNKFLTLIRSKYRNVPYHNFFHAFDVTQTAYAYMHMAGLERVLRKEEQFALLLACVCHDVDHMGLNNAFHMRAETPLAIMTSISGQKSVLEVHHCNVTVDFLAKTQLLAPLSHEQRARIHKLVINCILATDMAVHREKVTEIEQELAGRFDPQNEHHRALAMILLLKMADVSNVTKDFDNSRQWGIAVTEEFYQQGDAERDAGLDVTPMFDRERKVELAKGQIGFINALAGPFFNMAARVFPDFKQLAANAEANVGHWQRVLAATSDS